MSTISNGLRHCIWRQLIAFFPDSTALFSPRIPTWSPLLTQHFIDILWHRTARPCKGTSKVWKIIMLPKSKIQDRFNTLSETSRRSTPPCRSFILTKLQGSFGFRWWGLSEADFVTWVDGFAACHKSRICELCSAEAPHQKTASIFVQEITRGGPLNPNDK